jgi:hypothetical protein
MIMAFLLDLANIVGGLLLAVPLLRQIPSAAGGVDRAAGKVAPWAWVVGVVALVAGGFYLIVHLFEGRILHFEVVGILVGLALLWDRLGGRSRSERWALPLAIFGLIAVVVGLQGLFTPN